MPLVLKMKGTYTLVAKTDNKVKKEMLVAQSCLTLWDPTVALQAPLSMELSRQKY